MKKRVNMVNFVNWASFDKAAGRDNGCDFPRKDIGVDY
jgi:hypothetical protein